MCDKSDGAPVWSDDPILPKAQVSIEYLPGVAAVDQDEGILSLVVIALAGIRNESDIDIGGAGR